MLKPQFRSLSHGRLIATLICIAALLAFPHIAAAMLRAPADFETDSYLDRVRLGRAGALRPSRALREIPRHADSERRLLILQRHLHNSQQPSPPPDNSTAGSEQGNLQ